MKNLGTVISFTIKEMLRRKSFIISTIIILVLIVIGFNIPNIMKLFINEETASGGEKLLIVDSENVFERTLESLNSMDLGYDVEVTNENLTIDTIKERINNDERVKMNNIIFTKEF